MRKKRVVVESPFAGVSDPIQYLASCMRDCFNKGEVPFASHGLYTHKGCFNDHDPDERKMGMEGGLLWGELADCVVVYQDHGISKGMHAGIDHYLSLGKQIVFRRLK